MLKSVRSALPGPVLGAVARGENFVVETFNVPEQHAFAVLVLMTILVLVLVSRLSSGPRGLGGKRKAGSATLLLGQCGSGKTCLFYRLFADTFPECVTSMEVNDKTFPVVLADKETPKRVLDFPGHARLRGLLPTYLKDCGNIIFVIDSANKDAKVLREVADLMYDVFSECIRINTEPRVLICCNKVDLGSDVMSTDTVKKRLEKELDNLKSTRHSMETEGEDGMEIILGTEGAPFDFDNDAGCDVEFCAISAKKGGVALNPVVDFLFQ